MKRYDKEGTKKAVGITYGACLFARIVNTKLSTLISILSLGTPGHYVISHHMQLL